jgi:hypothetical protein
MAQLNDTFGKSKTSAVRLALLNGLSDELSKIAFTAPQLPKPHMQRRAPTSQKLTALKPTPMSMTAPSMPSMTPMTTKTTPAAPMGSTTPAAAPAVVTKP